MCVRLSLLANVSLLWSYRCGKSKQVVLLADGRLSFWGRIEPRGVLESPIMNYCLFVILSIRIYFLLIDSYVVSEKENLLSSTTIYVWAENPGPNAANSVNQLPSLLFLVTQKQTVHH